MCISDIIPNLMYKASQQVCILVTAHLNQRVHELVGVGGMSVSSQQQCIFKKKVLYVLHCAIQVLLDARYASVEVVLELCKSSLLLMVNECDKGTKDVKKCVIISSGK